jgi:hypothetical protein
VRSDLTALGIGNGQYPANDAEPRMLRDAGGLRHAITMLSEVRSSTGNPVTDPTYVQQVGWCRETIKSVANWHKANTERVTATIQVAKMRQVADGASCDKPFDMGVTGADLAVPPAAYRLTAAQYATISGNLARLGITATPDGDNYLVSMAQEAQPLIPYVLDPGSTESVVDGTPIAKTRPANARSAGRVLIVGGRRCRVDRLAYVTGGQIVPQ